MAENKSSFILYTDLIHTVEKLPDDKAGELFKTILRYVNDQNPIVDDLLIQISFEPVKQQLKRDLRDWEAIKEVRAQTGRLGGIKSGITRKKQKEANEANALKSKQKEANEAVNVNVNVNVKKRNKNTPASASAEVEIYNSCKSAFLTFYQATYQTEYYFEGKDGKKIKTLIGKIKTKLKEKYNGSYEAQNEKELIPMAFKSFISKANHSDQWITDNFSLSNIDSKFNDIYSKIKTSPVKESIKPIV